MAKNTPKSQEASKPVPVVPSSSYSGMICMYLYYLTSEYVADHGIGDGCGVIPYIFISHREQDRRGKHTNDNACVCIVFIVLY